MQSVSFNSVEEFLDFLPEDELKITELVRDIIFDCVPDVREKLSFNVPYYHRNKGLFFIWPAAILWGSKKSYTGVRFGFQQGYLLADDIGYLDKGNRKLIYYHDFRSLSDLDEELLKQYIFDAVLVDDGFKKTGRK